MAKVKKNNQNINSTDNINGESTNVGDTVENQKMSNDESDNEKIWKDLFYNYTRIYDSMSSL